MFSSSRAVASMPPSLHLRYSLVSRITILHRPRLTVSTIFQPKSYISSNNSSILRGRRLNVQKYPDAPYRNARMRLHPGIVRNLDLIITTIKQNPLSAGLIVVMICVCMVFIIFIIAAEVYMKLFVKHNFPESVLKPIRKALYFSIIRYDPSRAVKYYKEAILAAQEADMHYAGDEALGLKLSLASFFEDKCKDLQSALVVYEEVYKECIRFLQTEGNQHFRDGHRSRVLEKSVRVAVKLGELYGTSKIRRFDDAEEMFAVATETILKERQRRKETGVQSGEGDFLSNEEVGASLEAFATAYMSRKRYELATPLYVHALSLCPPKSCHTIVLMNNIASSIAEQRYSSNQPSDSSVLSQQAELWAKKAIEASEAVPLAERTQECSIGCATALANLAELAEQTGQLTEAMKLFTDAHRLAKSIGFVEGSQVASSGIKRLTDAMKDQR